MGPNIKPDIGHPFDTHFDTEDIQIPRRCPPKLRVSAVFGDIEPRGARIFIPRDQLDRTHLESENRGVESIG